MTRYETPAFDPAIAFSWTLRSEEIARRRRHRARHARADWTTFENERRDVPQASQHAAGYETPAFKPGVAFSWTLRSAEIACRQSRQPFSSEPSLTELSVLIAA